MSSLINKMLLILIDRDGTIIEDMHFLGKNEYWKSEIKYKKNVLDLLKHIQQFPSKFFVISNQSGVARKLFNCKLVEEINSHINNFLIKENIIIDDWNYCPDVDEEYVKKKREIEQIEQIDFDTNFIKVKTKRKPSPDMILDVLNRNNHHTIFCI